MIIAGWQTHSELGDVPTNLRRLTGAAEQAASVGADVLVTPEMFVTGYELSRTELGRLAKPQLLKEVGTIARRAGISLVVGMPVADGQKIYNAAVYSDGLAPPTIYRKAHLFGDLDRENFSAGDRPYELVEIRGVRVAMMICYDVEFAESVRSASVGGAQVVIVPTAQMEPFEFVADHLIRVRAWENQVYVAYINFCGGEKELRYVGRSSVVAPNGAQLAYRESGEGLLIATIDQSEVLSAQQANPYLDDRRPEIYGGYRG